MSNIEMIRAAGKRLAGQVRRTPLLSSPFLDEIAGRPIFVKAECLQHTGSFKFRGGWSAVSALSDEQRRKGVVAFSSGNHAQGVALAARLHGISSAIVMPADAPKIKIENTRALGAEVILYDREKESREEIGQMVQEERGLFLIRPFDEPLVIAGQGTSGLEIAEQARELGIERAEVAVPCGGGGLTSGIALALAEDMPGARVRPVEPEGFDDVTRSLRSGKIEKNSCLGGSLCDAILTVAPGRVTYPILQAHCGDGVIVTDKECLRAVALAFERLKIVVEPGGAAALAALLFRRDAFREGPAIAVATGGNVDGPVFKQALTEFGEAK